uniref:Transposable element P transposase-like RNase H domain-containing protein n=1 Tax=Anopheles stephensi TaxID=30069 RepID=A0A182YT62_ANOST
MTKEIMTNIINKLHEKGINVAGIVSDNCSSNISCWRELGAQDYMKPFFEHPVTKKNIYVFPDAPHLLKLLRNWLVDHGFHYKDKVISAKPLLDLIEVKNGKMYEEQQSYCPVLQLSHCGDTCHTKKN